MLKFIDFIIKFIVFFGFTFSLWVLLGDTIMSLFRDRLRYRKILLSFDSSKRDKAKNKVFEFLNMALKTVFKNDLKYGSYFLVIGSIMIFVFCFLLLLNIGDTFTALLISLALAASPYALLLVRLRSIRIDGSYEGEALVTALTNFYKENYYNMREAVDLVANSSSVGSFTRANLFILSLALKSYRNEEELDKAIQSFVFSYNTEWAIMLGMNIKVAVFNGSNVSVSLDDIVDELKSVREVVEQNKRFNSESFAMIRFLLIPLYILTIYFSISFFGFTLDKFIKNQFFDPLGLKFFIFTAVSIIFCFVFLLVIKKPKYDLK